MRRISLLSASVLPALMGAFLSLGSCENTAAPKLGSYVLTSVSGDSQTVAVGDGLQVPMKVRVMAGARPLAGIAVAWASEAGLLDGEVSKTDINGYSTMGWTMGRVPGTFRAVASVPTVGTVKFTATATVGPFAQLKVTPRVSTLADVGDTATVAFSAMDRFGNRVVPQPTVTWSSLHPLIATVSTAGLVRGVTGGTASIIASYAGVKDSTKITVQQKPASVELITRTATMSSLRATVPLQANVLDRLGNVIPGGAATWTSLDPFIVAVDSKGVVTAVGNGVGRVRVAAGSNADTAQITVAQAPFRMALLPLTATLPAGDSMLIQATAYDSLGSIVPDPPLRWVNGDANILQLLTGGWVRGLRLGTARIYVSSGNAAANAVITVRNGSILNVSVSPDGIAMRVGDTQTFTATATDGMGNVAPNLTFLWASSDTSRAVVTSDGVVTARALGTVLISATTGTVTGYARLTVASQQPASVRATKRRDTLNYIGATRQLSATVYDALGAPMPTLIPTWSALDPILMSVTSAGLVTQNAGGGALARALVSFAGATDTVTFVLRQVPRTITVFPTSLSLAQGDSTPVTLVVGPDSGGTAIGSTAVIESDPSIAIGRWKLGTPYIIGVGVGSATVSFYAGGATTPVATVAVTVTAPAGAVVPVEPTPGIVVPPAARREGGGPAD